jgi:hypothetical protein
MHRGVSKRKMSQDLLTIDPDLAVPPLTNTTFTCEVSILSNVFALVHLWEEIMWWGF